MSLRKSWMPMFCGLAALIAVEAHAGLLITEVVDATLGGGNPKFVEITNTDGSDYTFTGGGIVVQSNASTDLNIDVDLTGIMIQAGQSYVIQSTSNGGQDVFESTYGFSADLYTEAYFSNGDDRYILADADDGSGVATSLVDIHGEIDTDGTGTAWEYTDSYAYRKAGPANGGVFDISQWFHAGVDALQTGDDEEEKSLILELTTPGEWSPVPEPTGIALLLAGLLGMASMRRR